LLFSLPGAGTYHLEVFVNRTDASLDPLCHGSEKLFDVEDEEEFWNNVMLCRDA
jgi:hypothetical protein